MISRISPSPCLLTILLPIKPASNPRTIQARYDIFVTSRPRRNCRWVIQRANLLSIIFRSLSPTVRVRANPHANIASGFLFLKDAAVFENAAVGEDDYPFVLLIASHLLVVGHGHGLAARVELPKV